MSNKSFMHFEFVGKGPPVLLNVIFDKKTVLSKEIIVTCARSVMGAAYM